MSSAQEWIDPETGHRVRRLSSQPGTASLYFNYNAYTPEGDYLILQTPAGISKVSLADESFQETHLITIQGRFRVLFTGRKSRNVYWQTILDDPWNGGTVYAVDIDTGEQRKIVEVEHGHVQDINCDETLLGVVQVEPGVSHPTLDLSGRNPKTDQVDYSGTWPDGTPMTYADAKERRLDERLEAHLPMTIFTLDTRTGQRQDVYSSNDWLNHLLFSPTDPTLLMYCHEGAWHKVDRLWLIRTVGKSTPIKLHTRTMSMEIAGHEWWSHDGKTVWYDVQQPRGEKFWVAGYEIDTGKRTWYHLERNEWSVHYHSNPANTLFSGDGGDSEMVARGDDAKWLYLFRPERIPDVAGIKVVDQDDLIQTGLFKSEKLLKMTGQDYKLEPNCNFTPDGKWLIFSGNWEGVRHAYAVEVAKANKEV